MNETGNAPSVWHSGEGYINYVGRWSTLVARTFLEWLAQGPDQRWLDVGCGTGTLVRAILESAAPQSVTGVDSSEAFLAYARERISDSRAEFRVEDARQLSADDRTFDAVVSGLVLNFIPEPQQAIAEMVRVTRPGGTIAVYVWDYAGAMQMMRVFWDAAVALDSSAAARDEGRRCQICNPDGLSALFLTAGCTAVETRPIDVRTVFRDFDDYWLPFTAGQGPAPSYTVSLAADHRDALRERIRESLPIAADGSIDLLARAWAVRATA